MNEAAKVEAAYAMVILDTRGYLYFKYLSSTFILWPITLYLGIQFKWDPYLPYPRGPDTEGREGKGREGKGREGKGREGKGPTCEYLLVP